MAMQKLGEYWGKLKPKYDDDVVNRLNYMYTNIVILGFALTIAAKQFVGEPLQCWTPHQFTKAWGQYIVNYCFVENTYWLRMNESIPKAKEEREELEIQYYQWVPFVLALQALLFYTPRMIWKLLNFQTGVNISALIQTALKTRQEGDKMILKGVTVEAEMIAKKLGDVVDYQRDGPKHKNAFTRAISNSWGIYVTVLYLVVKALFIVNVVAQFFILNKFLGPKYTWWGYEILRDLANGVSWQTSGHFPRVTMCDLDVRQLGQAHTWSVQCVLVINMFNEKIYLFLWWWFLIVAVVNIINFLYWLVISLVPSFSQDFIGRYLQKHIVLRSQKSLNNFIDHSLRKDGITVLRLISDNCGDLVTAEIVKQLWNVQYGVNNSGGSSDGIAKPTAPHETDDEHVSLVSSDISHDKPGEFHEQ